MEGCITGINKTNFGFWYDDYLRKHFKQYNGLFEHLNECFNEVPFEMQIGVYLAFYDSLGFVILIDYHNLSGQFSYAIDRKGYDVWFNSRNEAYKEAFKKANELINQQLNNK